MRLNLFNHNLVLWRTDSGWSLTVSKRPQGREERRLGQQSYDPGATRLNVGGGKNHPVVTGWTVVDLRASADIRLDITAQPLPLADSSAALIFCSHVLEHIPPHRLGFVLAEFFRVLQPGGLLRLAVPDIEKAARAYAAGDAAFFQRAKIGDRNPDLPLGGQLAQWFYSSRIDPEEEKGKGLGHVHGFDFDYLRYWLEAAGFDPVVRSSYRDSACPELTGDAFDRHPEASLFVEAMKP